MANRPTSIWVVVGIVFLCSAIVEGASVQRSVNFRRLLVSGSFNSQSSTTSSNCKVTGPCLPCTATEKATEAVCDESGYRQAVECPSTAAQSTNLTDPRRLEESLSQGRDSGSASQAGVDYGSEDRGIRVVDGSKKLLQAGAGEPIVSTFQACWPEGRQQGLTVLGFETIVALVLTVAAPVMVYRRRKAGSNASTQGMQRIPSNNRF